jgi:hypothetical protein
MSIIDTHRDDQFVIQTMQGEIYVSKNVEISNIKPIQGMVTVEDKTTGKSWWINLDHLVYIGPRR